MQAVLAKPQNPVPDGEAQLRAPVEIVRYEPAYRARWDDFVHASKNGTFLFSRDYMDYHADRFADASLMMVSRGEILALLPAHRVAADCHSHNGLTYGGLVVSDRITIAGMVECFDRMLAALRADGVDRLTYKTIPFVYHRVLADEDRWPLWQHRAQLHHRNILSVIDMRARPAVQQRRLRGARKARKAGILVGESADWGSYWSLLSARLAEAFGAQPVHSLAEIERLQRRFPGNIRLFVALAGHELLGGTVIYETELTARAQYVASSQRGRDAGALDFLFAHLLDDVYPGKRYFDFGTSHDPDNEISTGLIDYKEGFGARAVAQDFYTLDLT